MHQAEVEWEGDHKPQLPEALHQAEVGCEGDHKPQLPEALHQEDMVGFVDSIILLHKTSCHCPVLSIYS